MSWFFKTLGEKIVDRVVDGLPLQNTLDSLQFMAEELKKAYEETIATRGNLRDKKDELETLRSTGSGPVIIMAAETVVRDAEKILREKETLLRIKERVAKSKFPSHFANL